MQIHCSTHSVMQIPAHRIWCCDCNIQIYMDYRNPVEEKGWHGHSKWERARGLERAQEREPTPAWTGFYCSSRHITSRMVLIYYAQVCLGWLPFTDNKEEDVAKYIKEVYLQCKGRNGWNRLCSILGRSSSDFRKLKILSKHFLPQFRVREFSKSKCHSSLGTMQAWFPLGEPIRGCGSCLSTSLPTGFSECGLGYISQMWNSSL